MPTLTEKLFETLQAKFKNKGYEVTMINPNYETNNTREHSQQIELLPHQRQNVVQDKRTKKI